MAWYWRAALGAAAAAVLLTILTQTTQDAIQMAFFRWPAISEHLFRASHMRQHSMPEPVSNMTVWWFAPFFSGGGYSSEALGLVLGLDQLNGSNFHDNLRITQHGDAFNSFVYKGLPAKDKLALGRLANAAAQPVRGGLLAICHSEPGAWALPKPLFQTSQCPPPGLDVYKVGRTMFETDRLSAEHARRINAMDEVWVPSSFQRDVFLTSGVDPKRVFVVPEPVDVDFFSPRGLTPLDLSSSELVFGRRLKSGEATPFVFVSVFKWEARKGWDVLLEAYLSEFSRDESVMLYLLTNAYHTEANFKDRMQQWAEQRLGSTGLKRLPCVFLVSKHVPQVDLPRFYLAGDVFVLPSRGEGWGRPHVEAMSMELPVIATNWSGPTAFLDESNGYPLQIDGLEEITEAGAFQGHKWASPSVQHLRQLMRHVTENRDEARGKGAAARDAMVRKYAPHVVAELVEAELRRIARSLQAA